MDRRLELPEGLDPRIASIIQDCWHRYFKSFPILLCRELHDRVCSDYVFQIKTSSDPEKRPSFEDIIRRMTSMVQRVATTTTVQRNQEC